MHILLYSPNYIPATRYGGPIRSCHGLAKALVARGHTVEVYTTNVDGARELDVPIDTPVTVDGVSVRYFPISRPRRLYRSPSMASRARADITKFDIVHLNGTFLWPGQKLGNIARKANVAVVIAPRGMLIPELIAGKSAIAKRLWIMLMERKNLASAAAIHVTSQEEALGIAALGLDLAPVTIIPNGISPPKEQPRQDDIEALWSHIPKGRRVAFLGRLAWQKGVGLAIDTVRAHGNCALLIAGPDEANIASGLASRLPAGSRFVGELDETRKWAFLAGADVLLVPSLKESFGMSVGEALSIGTPVICSEGVGAKTIVAMLDPGAVVPRDVAAFTSALKDLLGNPDRRKIFGTSAKKLMLDQFNWPRIAMEMEEVYAAACERRNE